MALSHRSVVVVHWFINRLTFNGDSSLGGGRTTSATAQTVLGYTAATPMVAVPSGFPNHHGSGHGGGGAAALTMPQISLRKASTMEYVQWNIAFDNVIAMRNLTQVVADNGPPSRDAINASTGCSQSSTKLSRTSASRRHCDSTKRRIPHSSTYSLLP